HAAGYQSVLRSLHRMHLPWLAACFAAQLTAYVGYVIAVWSMARLDDGPRLPFALTARTVVAGFGVYAATHSSGGFAVDYCALRRWALPRREAIRRVLGLGALEYAILAPAALISALVLIFEGGDHVQDAMTFPWLLVIPGFVLAAWVTSPKRAARLSQAEG